MKNQVFALRNLDGILLKLKVYVKFPQGFRCVNIKFPQSVNFSPLSFGMVSASGIIELTRLKLASTCKFKLLKPKETLGFSLRKLDETIKLSSFSLQKLDETKADQVSAD